MQQFSNNHSAKVIKVKWLPVADQIKQNGLINNTFLKNDTTHIK